MDGTDWDVMYQEKSAVWSGNPNSQLVAETSALTPGTALDVGCGEGADAVWLAFHGWQVTAVDVSPVALERARAHAAAAGADIDFVQRDLVAEPPSPSSYDLVSAQFFQLPDPPRSDVVRTLGEAVSPGGYLMVVGHHPSDQNMQSDNPRAKERLYPPEEIVALLSPTGWTVVLCETRERRALHHEKMSDLVDSVVLMRRNE